MHATCAHVFVYVLIRGLGVGVCPHVHACVCVSVHTCVSGSVRAYYGVHVRACVYVCVCGGGDACMGVPVCMCACVPVCMQVLCVHVCTFEWARTSHILGRHGTIMFCALTHFNHPHACNLRSCIQFSYSHQEGVFYIFVLDDTYTFWGGHP